MSRIPVPSHSPSVHKTLDRSSSPVPPQPARHAATMSASNLSALSDTRKKQSKRDEAIRKKIESELARKRTISSTHHTGTRSRRTAKPAVAKGTVAALKPSPALTVPENITVAEASQLCAAKRTDCKGLSGIFTAKDLAYRVTADGLDPHHTPVSQIMTRGPMVTRDTTSATEALQLMVQRHFRHLPVVFHEALDKVERSSSASEKLYNALAGVQSELGPGVTSNPQAAAMLAYVDALREKTALPDLSTVMDARTQPAVVSPKTTVRDVAKLMKEHRVTAVCVMENIPAPDSAHPKIVGIFTSKDVVLRVIAAGLDANICSVIRVMTPHPDTAPPTMSVHDALKKMHYDGHYLNLPVVETDGRLVAIVDVLKLTYATLEQMNAMTTDAPGDAEGGPMWGRFFDSIGGHEDTESMLSGSHRHTDAHSLSTRNISYLQQSPNSEVHPNDSASVVDDDQESALEGYPRKKGNRDIPAITGLASNIPVDDGTYVFKFRTPSGRTHRFQARHDSVEMLREIVCGKLSTDPFFTEFSGNPEDKPDPTDFTLSYTDADGDMVLITSDSDIADAVKIARTGGSDRVVLVIEGGKHWTEAGADKSEDKAKAVAEAAEEQLNGSGQNGVVLPPDQELVMGIPKDLLLPASIGVLAVVIVGVFTISRLTRD
ncbi:hypothetical protein EDD15DRAFT_2275715 [Pisolithus albus]|nr:hypothetical protein EDD15DRAFT_2275715 [Pisolithus albus]